MLLKSLEIHGFKSFPDKVTLAFGAGITAVVGPNGSGKSNISDAIRWVLGEQSTKSLRGSKMEDVIFSGTAARRGVGYAEVALTIDNSQRRLDFDGDEVRVARRYYRSGESEYLLGGATVRLRDVQLLFMDTGLGRDGYSMIGQGRIGDIVSSRSDERREIFEEAAGIAKYRYRKNEAERRLAGAEDNLVRLRDILQELEERVGPLEKQAAKAKVFLELAAERKELEIGVWLRTMDDAREVLRELGSALELARTQHDAAGTDIVRLEAEAERLSGAALELEAGMDAIRREGAALEEEAVRLEGEVAVRQNDIFHNNERAAQLREQQARFDLDGQALAEEMTRQEALAAEKDAQALACEARQLTLAEEMEALSRSSEEVSGTLEALSAKAAALALALADARVKRVENESTLAEITARASRNMEALTGQGEQAARTAEELARFETEGAALAGQVEELHNAVRGYELRHTSRAAKLEKAREAADKLRLDAEEARRRVRMLEELEHNMEGFSGSVKAVMQQADRGTLRGLHGPVSRLIETEAAYALAVETALGAAAQHLVCDTEEDAKRGIAYLRDTRAGRATFLPISAIRGRSLEERGLTGQPGFVGIASALVRAEGAYTDIVENLLGRIVVAQNLDDAVRIGKAYSYRFRVVTLDGQVVNAGGSMTGGSVGKSAGLLSRRAEIERLQERADGLSAQFAQAAEALTAAKQEAAAAEAALSGARGELSVAQEDSIRCAGEVRRLTEQMAAYQAAEAALRAETEELTARAAACRAHLADADAAMTDIAARQGGVETALADAGGGREALAAQRDGLAARMGDEKLAALALRKEAEAARGSLLDLAARREGASGQRTALEEQAAALEAANVGILEQIAGALAQVKTLRAQAAATSERVDGLVARRMEGEAARTAIQRGIREKSEEREVAGREVARLEERCVAARRDSEELGAKLFEEYELTRAEAEALVPPVADAAAANRRLTELRGKIRALGSINVDAIEEYREVSERYTTLKEQVADVEVSRTELLGLIGELTVQMREMFLTRFQQINYQYGLAFAELFGGGKGELKLADPEDILHSGIELYVQPPGKKILHLDALSGGEKALAAIALLFAILKVTPSPFCVLDEIEAALDDVNVDRYAQYLRNMSKNIQFIVITHRRGTMEEADVLYGVTMQELGISKLLELRVSEAERLLSGGG